MQSFLTDRRSVSADLRLSALAVLPLFVPGHLDGFEFFLVRVLGIVAEAFESRHPFMEIGESNGQRIGIRELVGERNGNVFSGRPGQMVCSLDFPHALVFQRFRNRGVHDEFGETHELPWLSRSIASRIA